MVERPLYFVNPVQLEARLCQQNVKGCTTR